MARHHLPKNIYCRCYFRRPFFSPLIYSTHRARLQQEIYQLMRMARPIKKHPMWRLTTLKVEASECYGIDKGDWRYFPNDVIFQCGAVHHIVMKTVRWCEINRSNHDDVIWTNYRHLLVGLTALLSNPDDVIWINYTLLFLGLATLLSNPNDVLWTSCRNLFVGLTTFSSNYTFICRFNDSFKQL